MGDPAFLTDIPRYGGTGVAPFVAHSDHKHPEADQYVGTSETTASTTYTDLATVGPAVTLTVPQSGKVKFTITCDASINSANFIARVSVAVSGTDTVAASDGKALEIATQAQVGAPIAASVVYVLSGLTPGASDTFTMKYRTSGGTATFVNRQIVVEGL